MGTLTLVTSGAWTGNVDISSGATDWMALDASQVSNTKSGGPGRISIANVGGASSLSTATQSWPSGGTPTGSQTATNQASYSYNTSAPLLSYVVTIGTTVDDIYIYGGGGSNFRYTISLSDGSATPLSATRGSAGDFKLHIQAGANSAGQTVTIAVDGVSNYAYLNACVLIAGSASAPAIGGRSGIKGPRFLNNPQRTLASGQGSKVIDSDGGPNAWGWAGTTSTITQLINQSAGAWSWAGTTSSTSQLINQSVGAWNWSGTTSTATQIINAAPGAYSWAGTTAATSQLINSDGGATAWSWAGTTATIAGVLNVSGIPGIWSWAGTTATISQLISASPGTWSWAGTTSVNTQLINQAVGAYTWVGTTSTTIQLIFASPNQWSWMGTTATIPGIANPIGNRVMQGIWQPVGSKISGSGH